MGNGSVAEVQAKTCEIEADLLDQGIEVYPATPTGDRARELWIKIRPELIRGGGVKVTISALGLGWHREQLKRARATLIDMGLIKPRTDGRYVLGPQRRHSRVDDLIREEFFALKLLVGVLIALEALAGKSKTQGKRSCS